MTPAEQTTTTMMKPMYSAGAEVAPDGHFEGPEKKLEVFFTAPVDGRGFRCFSQATWSDVLADAHCSILHSLGNDSFDAYLLSESSLFVYPHKLIFKTCGTTTLLLVLSKLLGLASKIGCTLSHVHYSHYRYAFPQLQPSPHSSFEEEQATVSRQLRGHITDVTAALLGADHDDDVNATRWFALCASAPSAHSAAPCAGESDVIELAMEGLDPATAAVFFVDTHAPLLGRALAAAMSAASGVAALVPHATIDDWAFEPCGYSMNALSGPYYYTVHVTPESGFSYASFETNDPAFTSDAALAAVLAVFRPRHCTASITSRSSVAAPGAAKICAERTSPCPPTTVYATVAPWRTTRLSGNVAVSVAAYSARDGSPPPPMRRAAAADVAETSEATVSVEAAVKGAALAVAGEAASVGGRGELRLEERAFSSRISSAGSEPSADSESTAALDEACRLDEASESASVVGSGEEVALPFIADEADCLAERTERVEQLTEKLDGKADKRRRDGGEVDGDAPKVLKTSA